MSRLHPVVTLFVLAPFVAEVLLGNVPLSSALAPQALPILTLLYGGGAVLIRETARHRGGGLRTITLLALGYGILEEGLITQSLFNPGYAGLDLLSYGALPALGMGGPWTVFVLAIHSIWSIVVPIVLVEALFPGRGRWLGVPGTIVVTLLFVVAGVFLAVFTAVDSGFVASPAQLAGAGAAVAVVVTAALRLPQQVALDRSPVWPASGVGLLTFAGGSVFFGLYWAGPAEQALGAWTYVLLTIVVAAATFGVLTVQSRRAGWSPRHTLAAAAGATVTYCWAGFLVHTLQFGVTAAGMMAQTGAVVVALGVLAAARWRTRIRATTRGSRPLRS